MIKKNFILVGMTHILNVITKVVLLLIIVTVLLLGATWSIAILKSYKFQN